MVCKNTVVNVELKYLSKRVKTISGGMPKKLRCVYKLAHAVCSCIGMINSEKDPVGYSVGWQQKVLLKHCIFDLQLLSLKFILLASEPNLVRDGSGLGEWNDKGLYSETCVGICAYYKVSENDVYLLSYYVVTTVRGVKCLKIITFHPKQQLHIVIIQS